MNRAGEIRSGPSPLTNEEGIRTGTMMKNRARRRPVGEIPTGLLLRPDARVQLRGVSGMGLVFLLFNS